MRRRQRLSASVGSHSAPRLFTKMKHASALYIGTAGWSLPSAVRPMFDAAGSQLTRYSGRLDCVEINSSFYRPHRPATYDRWRTAVPRGFRFAVKAPRSITHEARLKNVGDTLTGFLGQASALAEALGPILFQLPPSLAFDRSTAESFLALLRRVHAGEVVFEPRHQSWFEVTPEAMFTAYRVGRVAADPACCSDAAKPGGWPGLRYWRLHGSPKMYFSAYGETRLEALAPEFKTDDWCIFDNTASGAAIEDAMLLRQLIEPSHA